MDSYQSFVEAGCKTLYDAKTEIGPPVFTRSWSVKTRSIRFTRPIFDLYCIRNRTSGWLKTEKLLSAQNCFTPDLGPRFGAKNGTLMGHNLYQLNSVLNVNEIDTGLGAAVTVVNGHTAKNKCMALNGPQSDVVTF